MGLLGRRARTITCPMCRTEIRHDERREHWESHVEVIPEGQGAASGQFTWRCTCGPAGMKWEKRHAAVAGIQVHLMDRHGIPI